MCLMDPEAAAGRAGSHRTKRHQPEQAPSTITHSAASRNGSTTDLQRAMTFDSGGKVPIAAYADALERVLPKIACVGSAWYAFENGVYRPVDKRRFRPQAHRILRPDEESSGLAISVLNCIEGRHQISSDCLKSFAILQDDGAVLLNCRNGLLRVTADEIRLLDHPTDCLFTKQIAAAFDEQAPSDLFERVLTEALPEQDDQHLVLLFAAYTLLPHCDLHAALVCHGKGGTGKSTVWDAIAQVLGSDLVLNVSLRQICDGKGYSVPRLRFAALNLGDEAPSGELAESDMLKSLICGQAVEARPIYGKPEKLEGYSTKFVFLSNHLPHFRGGTDAELRRLRFLQFDHKPNKIDPTLPHGLASERNGIFSGLMVPCLQTLLRERVMPEGGTASRAIKARFAVENDPLGSFLAECCTLGPELYETKDRLHGAFLAWAKGKDVGPGLKTAEHFFPLLRSRQAGLEDYRPTVRGERPHCLKGLRLKDGLTVV